MSASIAATDYYDAFPTNEHVPGDVWAHFPSFGILQTAKCSALIITPACDLANRKVETLTYVPIIPISQYLASRDLVSDICRALEGQAVVAGCQMSFRANGQKQLQAEDVTAASILLAETSGQEKLGQKEESARNRFASGLKLLESILSGDRCAKPLLHCQTLFGESEFTAICKRIVTNGYRTDIHFLPSDGQEKNEWSAIADHSVALFRYPLTLPLELLDLSLDVHEFEWASIIAAKSRQYPCGAMLSGKRPIKLLRIRPRFVSDLLTRFLALYGRLGSPDFSPGTVDTFIQDIVRVES